MPGCQYRCADIAYPSVPAQFIGKRAVTLSLWSARRSRTIGFLRRSAAAAWAWCIAPRTRGSDGQSRSSSCQPERAVDPDAVERLRREARAASALNHPNICTIYDIGESDGRHFIAMELVEGETLAARIAGRPLPLAEALSIAVQLAEALDCGTRARHRPPRPQAGQYPGHAEQVTRRFWTSAWRSSAGSPMRRSPNR